MDTIFVKKYVAKGELPTANGWYTIKFSNSGNQSIEQLRFDISRKKFHDDDSEFDHVEYWLDEMTLSKYLDSILPVQEITIDDFSYCIDNAIHGKEITDGAKKCFQLAQQMTAKALEKRDLEWWENCILVDNVAPNPQAGKNWLASSNSHHEKLIREEYESKGYKSIERFQQEASKKYGYRNYEIATSQADTDTYGKINFEAEEAFNTQGQSERIKELEWEIKRLSVSLKDSQKEAETYADERDSAYSERNEARECEEIYQNRLKELEAKQIILPDDDEILKLANAYCQIGDGSTITQDKVSWRNIMQNGMTLLRTEIQRQLDKK
jgi:hypothetical protein